ncbi:TetR family transcriptional regulator [Actinocorallia herbida]|uniref:TetR family transcriptional regulator n=1 Tax=Actinocorallia herbida TaxID=58109 RepID=A0A3N1D4W8_9ACTN|nr:TetR/AcrR family transcriptional regulator [Actinocorallia herbida]ROO88128.1 TetR family transcriptional regulator [Actinocorallia herbida]
MAPDTRDRIVEAARAEFARYGIAGARIDRIAKTARTSKERVYAYFRSKEALYAHVASIELAAVADAVHLDPADLPSYAAQMFDYFTAHPDQHRFIAWGRLELAAEPSGDDPGPYQTAIVGKLERIRRAQQDGLLDPTWDPVDIMALVSQIAHTWSDQTALAAVAHRAAADPAPAARRTAVVRAVTAIFPPAPQNR